MVLLVLGVFLFSVVFQAGQINSFFFDQQSRFYIYEAKEIVTYLSSSVSPDVIRERLLLHSRFLGASIIITDEKGNFLYSQHAEGRPQNERILENTFLKKTLSGQNVVISGKVAGIEEEVFLVAVPLVSKTGQIDGSVVIYSPLLSLKQQVYKMYSIAGLGTLLGIFLSTVLSVFIFRKFTGPLAEMEKTARAIAGGDFGKQLEVTSEDEVGRLAHSLNRMSSQLQEKIEAIERLDRVRQEFVSDVSHELRTPLTIIQGFSEAVLDGLVKSKEQQDLYLKNIIDEAQRLRNLVDDLLDLKAMEAGKTFDEKEYVVLNKLLGITSNRFRPVAASKGVTVNTGMPREAVIVFGSIDRLKQVFTNLIDNAVNYSPPGGNVVVEMGLQGDLAFVSIKDSGPGIPRQELDNIWERFYKIDKSRSRHGSGTGLGLSIVKNIVEGHGGHVTADNLPDGGAVFTVYLPVSI
jgi:signal transduction histidine kinase